MLLVIAVTLSAALIAAVACAIESANGAIRRQMESQLGSAELRIRPRSAGGTFPAEILETVRSWPEIESAVGKARDTVSVQFTSETLRPAAEGEGFAPEPTTFTTDAMANGVDLDLEFRTRPLPLLAGRLPETDGEVVLGAELAERLGWVWTEQRASGTWNRIGVQTQYLRTPPPEMPARASAAEAEALNGRVGPRPGDRVSVVRLFRSPISFDQIEQRFGLSKELLTNVARLFRSTTTLEVVGIAESPPLGGAPQAYMSLRTLATITGRGAEYDEVEIHLPEGTDAEAVLTAREGALPETVLLQTTEKVTSGLEQNLASSQIGFVLASILAMLSAAFIIMTGLTTGIAEQMRGLAIIRCIGGTKLQLAAAQLWTGLLVGGAGAILGVPLGVAFAWIMVTIYSEHLPTGLAVPPGMLVLAAVGSIGAGLLGAAWPAWQVSRVSPLRALANRAEPTKPRHMRLVIVFALLGLAIQAVTVGVPRDKDVLFWGYATVGLPAMFIGYFLLAVPVTILVAQCLAEPLSRLLRLPPRVLGRTVSATPFRHGFTAGAMMAGLALMISIWTNGGSILRDWLDTIRFPDAFVNGFRLPVEAQETLEGLPFVEATCAITMHPVQTDAFGLSGLTEYNTTFIAFEPDEFFAMTTVEFVEGDRETAIRRLNEGGAVIVGREFRVAQGLGVGDTFACTDRGTEHEFDIVGVVTSPGLELASKFFNIGEEYADQSIHAVFGSRRDMIERFGSDNIQLIQMDLAEGVDEQEAMAEIRRSMFGYGILDAGSGRKIKRQIEGFIRGSLVVFSGVAVASMLVACFGVANLIVAGIEARRFEFGVLRAVGGQQGLLVRLVAGEAAIIAIVAGIVGTLMGIQGAWAGSRIYALLLGVLMELRPPAGPIAVGWGVVMLFTVGAAIPAMIRLNRHSTRELLAAAKG